MSSEAFVAALKRIKFTTLLAMTMVAGIIYCSWPLQYRLNHSVAHRHGLASELGARGQPYNWLFDLLDIVAGLLVIVVAQWLWRVINDKTSWLKAAIISYGLFGLLTLIDAALPLNCLPSSHSCHGIVHNPLLIMHGAASIGASLALLVSALLAWAVTIERRHKSLGAMTTVALFGWLAFGIASSYFLLHPRFGFISQDYFIALCSLWIAWFPLVLVRVLQKPSLMLQ